MSSFVASLPSGVWPPRTTSSNLANPSAPAAVTGFILTSMHCAMFSQRQCNNSIADSFVIRPSAMSFW